MSNLHWVGPKRQPARASEPIAPFRWFESIGLGLATERFGGSFFGNGSTFGGVFQHPNAFKSDAARENFRRSIEARHQGVERAHKFLLIEEGITFQPYNGVPPEDAQFLQTRQFQVTEIARWFKVPPHKIGDLTRSMYSNIEQQDLDYYKSGLRHWLVRWEQEINRKLIFPLEKNTLFAEHLVDGILRGDPASRATFYKELFSLGAITSNEIARRENLPPGGPEGDIRYVPTTYQPVQQPPPGPIRALPAPDVYAANRDLLIGAFQHVVDSEAQRARKNAATPAQLRTWVEKYYELEEHRICDRLVPIVRAHLAWKDSPADPYSVTREIVAAYIGDSQRELLALCQINHEGGEFQGRVHDVVARWEQGRAAAFTDRLMNEWPLSSSRTLSVAQGEAIMRDKRQRYTQEDQRAREAWQFRLKQLMRLPKVHPDLMSALLKMSERPLPTKE